MELCENHRYCHIVYDGIQCPLCEAEEQIGSLAATVVDLNDQIVTLEREDKEKEDQI